MRVENLNKKGMKKENNINKTEKMSFLIFKHTINQFQTGVNQIRV